MWLLLNIELFTLLTLIIKTNSLHIPRRFMLRLDRDIDENSFYNLRGNNKNTEIGFKDVDFESDTYTTENKNKDELKGIIEQVESVTINNPRKKRKTHSKSRRDVVLNKVTVSLGNDKTETRYLIIRNKKKQHVKRNEIKRGAIHGWWG